MNDAVKLFLYSSVFLLSAANLYSFRIDFCAFFLSITKTSLTKGEAENISCVEGIHKISIELEGNFSFSFSIIGSVKIASPIKAVCMINIFSITINTSKYYASTTIVQDFFVLQILKMPYAFD